MLHRRWQLLDQDVAAAVDADHVRVRHPDHVDALLDERRHDLVHVLLGGAGVVGHGSSTGSFGHEQY